jgi:2-polyprenyl-3-methyl-5-hydroxy-6-metoxy-1,4-benzoquinol methylase
VFGNASHFATAREIELVGAAVAPGSRILDFGGGVGNLAIALAVRGHHAAIDELNALQRDFARFRVDRHRLGDRVSVLDPWADLPRAAFDAVTAFDVFEHMPDGRTILEERLLPALRDGGVLIEDSPFVRTIANPMHHADWGLAELLGARGFEVRSRDAHTRVWQSPTPG